MAIFGVNGDNAAFAQAPVSAGDVAQNGLFVTPSGFTRASFSGGPPVSFSQGLPIDAGGCVCVSSEAAIATVSNGLPFDANGRLCLTSSPVASFSNGLPFSAAGRLRAADLWPADGPTLDLNFVDTSEPTLSLDFTNEQYAVYVPDSTNTPVGTYRIWS